jgi:hypothetical protein
LKISKIKAATSTRHLGGVGKSIPRQDRTSKGLQAALNRRDGGPCEGSAVRPPTSGKMRARGGTVTNAETFENDSISNNPMFDPKKKSGLFGYKRGGKVK